LVYSSYGQEKGLTIKMTRLQTTDLELCTKLKALRFTDEVIIDKSKKKKLSKIIRNINRNDKKISSTDIGNHMLLKRLKPVNYNIEFRK